MPPPPSKDAKSKSEALVYLTRAFPSLSPDKILSIHKEVSGSPPLRVRNALILLRLAPPIGLLSCMSTMSRFHFPPLVLNSPVPSLLQVTEFVLSPTPSHMAVCG